MIPSISSTFVNRCYFCQEMFLSKGSLANHLRRAGHPESDADPDSSFEPEAFSTTWAQMSPTSGAGNASGETLLFRTDFRPDELLGRDFGPHSLKDALPEICSRATPANNKEFMALLEGIKRYEERELAVNKFPVIYDCKIKKKIKQARLFLLECLRALVEEVGILFMIRSLTQDTLWPYIQSEGLDEEVRLIHRLIKMIACHSMVLNKKHHGSHEFSDDQLYSMMNSKLILRVEPCWFSFDENPLPPTAGIGLQKIGPMDISPGRHQGSSHQDKEASSPSISISCPKLRGIDLSGAISQMHPCHGEPAGSAYAASNITSDATGPAQGKPEDEFPLAAEPARPVPILSELVSENPPAGISSASQVSCGPVHTEQRGGWTRSALYLSQSKAHWCDVLINRLVANHCPVPSDDCLVCIDRKELLRGFSFRVFEGDEWVRKNY